MPAGFAATSVTFVSPQEAFVLGTAPCAKAPCTSILRTLDRGASWRGLPAPVVALGNWEADTAGPAVWGIRFANPSDGFVFGNGLWETTDGGERWSSTASPGGSISSLEVIDGQVLALSAVCTPDNGCRQTGTLMRRPLAGGAWRQVARLTEPGAIATRGRVAAVIDGSGVLITANGGLSTVTEAGPCGSTEAAVAVTGPDGLALECAFGAAAGSVPKTVYVSDDLGAHWQKAGSPGIGGDPGGLSAGSASQLVAAASSGGASSTTPVTAGRRGPRPSSRATAGWASTTSGSPPPPTVWSSTDPSSPVTTPTAAGRLLLTSNGGASWQKVS